MHEKLKYYLKGNQSLFPEGDSHVDFELVAYDMCNPGYKPVKIDPSRKCNDRFVLFNGTLKPLDSQASNWRHKYKRSVVFKSDEFCIEVNGEAKSSAEHFATICVEEYDTKT